MGTISAASAIYGLRAAGTPTGTNVTGSVEVGISQTSVSFADADIAYSFKVTSTGDGDVATLTLSSGSVAQTTGTTTITDGDGKDFEGATLPSMMTVYALMVSVSGEEWEVGSTLSQLPDITIASGSRTLAIIDGGVATSTATVAFTSTAASSIITVTVLGKSS
jgi:ribosomal protein L31